MDKDRKFSASKNGASDSSQVNLEKTVRKTADVVLKTYEEALKELEKH